MAPHSKRDRRGCPRLYWCFLWSVVLIMGLGAGRLLGGKRATGASTGDGTKPPFADVAQGNETSQSSRREEPMPQQPVPQANELDMKSHSSLEDRGRRKPPPLRKAAQDTSPADLALGSSDTSLPAHATPAVQRAPAGEAQPADLMSFVQSSMLALPGAPAVSVLEVNGKAGGVEVGVRLAAQFPESTWVASGSRQPKLEELGKRRPGNLFQVDELTPEKLRSMYRAPQIFEYLLLPTFTDDFLDGGRKEELGLLLGMAQTVVVYAPPAAGSGSRVGSHIQQAGQLLVEVSDAMKMGVLVENVQDNIIRVTNTMLTRPVQHHFEDMRPALDGGTCYKYKLIHEPAAQGVKRNPKLCQVKVATPAPGTQQCPVDVECGKRTIELANGNWVNLRLLAGLGLSGFDRDRVIKMYMKMPSRDTMASFTNKGCARLDIGMKYDAKASCCLDLLLAALDPAHCGLSRPIAQSLSVGYAFDLDKVAACRQQHFAKSFHSMQFTESFIADAQTSFVFGGAREPSRMTKDAIEKELQERGLPTTIDAANSGSAKEQLIGRLEKARMDTSNLTHAELVAELRRLHLSTDGPEAQLAERLDRARELGYSHVKSRLMRGRLKNRIETLRGDVGKLSKEELKQYLRDANLDDGGDKEELVAKLRGAWKRSPGLKAASVAKLEEQLQLGGDLFDATRAQQEGGAGAAKMSADPGPPHWDAGSIDDLGELTGLGLQSVRSMSKKELQEEAGAAGQSTGGSKEALQRIVQRVRNAGQSGSSPRDGRQPAARAMPPSQSSPRRHAGSHQAAARPAGFDAGLDYMADALLHSAIGQSVREEAGPERMSR
eukprot:jgi/Tetstr1/424420/TSEL_014978.t1